MTYFPHSETEINAMLEKIGIKKIEDLLQPIPENYQIDQLDLPEGKNELETLQYFQKLADKNRHYQSVFMGGGAYHHFIPAAIDELTSRQEFYTAYTPYQAEVSQGTLQAIFEYQTYMCQLTGLDVSNASMYDGATALAEAVILSVGANRKKKVLVDIHLLTDYKLVLETYLKPFNIEITYYHSDGFSFNSEKFLENWDDTYSCFVISSPNNHGTITDYSSVVDQIHQDKGLMIHVIPEAYSLALFQSPRKLGADLACGDAMSFGIPLSFGGPYLGFLTCDKKYLRKMPGRIVGQTTDLDGNIAYTLTLSTREQHIRRENATSNICTNHGLCALRASIYLSLNGMKGLKSCALKNVENAHYLHAEIGKLKNFSVNKSQVFFNEFAVETKIPYDQLNNHLEKADILSFLPIATHPGFYQVCATEMNSKENIAAFIKVLEAI
ncbi:MAG: aminomethyl-transferring glycine dehydrogenase subunit GcvPA [Spirochaetes bacterium]|nr:aminomethyl-transferring glycine dehydrogenase subunit GcvPA [Spirochaetota bacterium]